MKWTADAVKWKPILEKYGRLGAKPKEFCAERQIKPSTLDYWRARLTKTAAGEAAVVMVARVIIELEVSAREQQLVQVLRPAGQL